MGILRLSYGTVSKQSLKRGRTMLIRGWNNAGMRPEGGGGAGWKGEWNNIQEMKGEDSR